MKSEASSPDKAKHMLRRLADTRGQTLVLAALCMVVVLSFIGLAVDVGHFRYEKRRLQTAADAAAIAGAIEVRLCGGTGNCTAMTTAAQKAMTENGYTNVTFTTSCPTGGAGVTLMISNPVSTCAVSNDPNEGKYNYVEAIVTEQVPTYFASIFGVNSVLVKTRAEAARGLGGPCIYALGGPEGGPYTDAAAVQVVVGVAINSQCGIVDESSNQTDALDCAIALGTSAPQIDVSGGVGGLLGGLLCSSTPPVRTNVPAPNPRDPLAYLPAPPQAATTVGCGTGISGHTYSGSASAVNITPVTLLTTGTTIEFKPGVYCGGISITASVLMNITFDPGIYVLRQGPGLLGPLTPAGGFNITISALSTITGNGVMFYNEGNPANPAASVGSLSVTAPATLGLSGFNLTAPTSGEYAGILFFQAHGVPSTGVFLVGLLQSTSNFQGGIYLPDATVSYAVSAISASYNLLVARDVQFTAGVASSFGNNFSTLTSGSPLNGDDVTLVQ